MPQPFAVYSMNNICKGVTAYGAGECGGENIFELPAVGDHLGNAARQGAPCRGGKWPALEAVSLRFYYNPDDFKCWWAPQADSSNVFFATLPCTVVTTLWQE